MTAEAIQPAADSYPLSTGSRRAFRLFLVFAVWAVVVVARLFQVMIVERGRLTADMQRTSWRHGMIPGLRGRILDADGRPLAWSVRHYALVWHRPADAQRAAGQWAALHAVLPLEPGWTLRKALDVPRPEVRLLGDLTPEQFRLVGPVCTRHPEFRIESSFVRETVPAPTLRRELGAVIRRNGMEIGVSGAERIHDSLLRGRPGLYRVMLDPAGAWVPETWERLRSMTPGYDVYLPIRLAPPADENAESANQG